MAAPHPSSDRDEMDEAKRLARKRARDARAGCDPELGTRLAAHVLAGWAEPASLAVSGFWPMPGEIDIRPLLSALHDRGHPVLLPVTPARGLPLIFRRWTPTTPMLRERFGTYCPAPDSQQGLPHILFVPLLAFDRAGGRLGYGGGYYDRTLAELAGARMIGCAFAAQEVDEVPLGVYDVRLSAVATEHGVIPCESD